MIVLRFGDGDRLSFVCLGWLLLVQRALILLVFCDAGLLLGQQESSCFQAAYKIKSTGISYSVRSIFRPVKVHHTIETGEGRSSALVPMLIEFLLRQDISACLDEQYQQRR